MDIQIEESLASLHSRHINGIFAENSEDARQKILKLIPQEAVVGIGDSTTIRQIGIPKILRERGIKILDDTKCHYCERRFRIELGPLLAPRAHCTDNRKL